MKWTRRGWMGSSAAALAATALAEAAGAPERTLKHKPHVVFVAGPRSHNYGAHEHPAGCRLLAGLLEQAVPGLSTTVSDGAWPENPAVLEKADAVVIYCDGDSSHVMNGHEEALDRVAGRGAGIGFLHYALTVEQPGQSERLVDWIGAVYELNWSVNPAWDAKFEKMGRHEVTRGVRPFEMFDEWYYHMRFRPGMQGVTPLLTALPPASSLKRKDGPHSNNPHVRQAVLERGEAQHLAWAATRPGGGRGFGFTGGHLIWNMIHDDYRMLLLNACAWLAGVPIPEEGLSSPTPGIDELIALMGKPPGNIYREDLEERIAPWPKTPRPPRRGQAS